MLSQVISQSKILFAGISTTNETASDHAILVAPRQFIYNRITNKAYKIVNKLLSANCLHHA
jgi:hypothetical protein